MVQGSDIKAGTVQVEIHNMLGQRVFDAEQVLISGQNSIELDISRLQTGTYAVRLSQDGQLWTETFIKE